MLHFGFVWEGRGGNSVSVVVSVAKGGSWLSKSFLSGSLPLPWFLAREQAFLGALLVCTCWHFWVASSLSTHSGI